MTYSEYKDLHIGDVIYYVNVRWQKMTIEPRKVVKIFDIPSRSPFIENDDGFFKILPIEFDLCFLTLDEASKRLEELINNHDKKRRKNYDLAPKKSKQKYVYDLTMFTI